MQLPALIMRVPILLAMATLHLLDGCNRIESRGLRLLRQQASAPQGGIIESRQICCDLHPGHVRHLHLQGGDEVVHNLLPRSESGIQHRAFLHQSEDLALRGSVIDSVLEANQELGQRLVPLQ